MQFIKVNDDIYPAETGILEIASYYLSDEEDHDFFIQPVDFDDDGEAIDWERVDRTDNEVMDRIGANIISKNEAIEAILSGANDCKNVLTEEIAIASADPEFLTTKENIKDEMTFNGWDVDRDKNNSIYFRKDGVRVRFSNHKLGHDWSGREQTGGADINFVWEKGTDSKQIISEIDEQFQEYFK